MHPPLVVSRCWIWMVSGSFMQENEAGDTVSGLLIVGHVSVTGKFLTRDWSVTHQLTSSSPLSIIVLSVMTNVLSKRCPSVTMDLGSSVSVTVQSMTIY